MKPAQGEERELIEAAQREPARFVDVYQEYFEVVYAYAARRTANRAEAEDLASEVFRKALENLPRFKWTGAPFSAWLFRIAANLIADRSRRASKEEKVTALPDAAGNTHQTQQSEVEDAERRARVFASVDDLIDDQRRVIVMRFAEDKSISEIATELNKSIGAVKQLQFRALKNLRAKLRS